MSALLVSEVSTRRDYWRNTAVTQRKPDKSYLTPFWFTQRDEANSHFAGSGDGFQVLFASGDGMWSGNDKNDCGKNHNGGNYRAQRDGFVHNEPAENQRHN